MKKTQILRLLAIAAVTALVPACGDSPTSPSHFDITAPRLGVNFQVAPPGYKLGTHAGSWESGHGSSQYSVSGLITAAGGGTITLPGADLQISFPAGAVSQDVTVTIVALSGPSVAYDFLPHGIHFAKPVTATQGLVNTGFGGVAGLAVYAAYLPDGYEDISALGSARALEIEASTTLLNSAGLPTSVIFTLNHFSKYILASGDAPPQPDSGPSGS
jgi:hypothetical protein